MIPGRAPADGLTLSYYSWVISVENPELRLKN
jgi:hypothetical protein